MSEVEPAIAWRRAPISMFASTCAGMGHLPGGPGTYAAAAALAPIWWCSHQVDLLVHLGVLALVTLASFWWCDRAGKALEVDDSNQIVLDEFLGVWWTLAFFTELRWVELAVGFAAFRFFDIAKPWPVRQADERVKGGFGVMLDDLLAAIWAALVVFGVRWLMS